MKCSEAASDNYYLRVGTKRLCHKFSDAWAMSLAGKVGVDVHLLLRHRAYLWAHNPNNPRKTCANVSSISCPDFCLVCSTLGGNRTPLWEHKSGPRNYFPFEFELQNYRLTRMLVTYNRIRPQKFRFRSGSSFAPHFCAPTGVSGKWGIRNLIPDPESSDSSLRLLACPRARWARA